MKKVLVFLVGLVISAVVMQPAMAMDFGGYKTGVRALALYNMRDEKLLVSENIDTKMEIASLTKIMTALVVLEETELKLDEKVTISKEMLANLTGWAVAGLKVGMTPTVEELLYMLMLPSGGDAGQALAVRGAGSIDAFSQLMNKKAEELELRNTHFSNPIGRDENNYSTAEDVAKMLFYALRNEEFRKIFEADEYQSAALGKKIYKTVSLGAKKLTGAKTGYTHAGRSLASTAKRGNVEYLLVVLDADYRTTKHIDDSLAIYKYYGENYGYLRILEDGEIVFRLPVDDAEVEEYGILADGFEYFAKKDFAPESFEYEFEGLERVNRRVGMGEKIGVLRVKKDGEEIYAQEVFLNEEIEYRAHVPETIAVVAGGVLVMTVVIILGRKIRKKKIRVIVWSVTGACVVAGVAIGIWMIWLPNMPEWKTVKIEKEVPKLELAVLETVTTDNREDEGTTASKPATTTTTKPTTSNTTSSNCSLAFGKLMLINPKWKVTTGWIGQRKAQLINIDTKYGIKEGNSNNGAPLMDAEAAQHLAQMLADYTKAYPGHKMETRSCFRSKGTNCGRLCYATGTSDHHSGYTCDLIDPSYGTRLNTDFYSQHKEWQWLKANSYKYGFIDRFPQAWAGGSMSQPVNITEAGTTGLYEAWHYRYVGVQAATEIATGKYNNGKYDSLEHYLKATGRVTSLVNAQCK